MDAIALKEFLYNEPERIEHLLHSAEFYHIKNYRTGKEIRCSRDYDGNPTGIVVNYDNENIPFKYFSGGLSGDIISLLQIKLDKSFREVLQFCYSSLGLSSDELVKSEKYRPFGAYYKKIQSKTKIKDIDLPTLPNEILSEFKQAPNMLFLNDGISIQTQNKYEIGYDALSMRISVPWFNHGGDLVGIMGRLNDEYVDESTSKWLPIIPFSKSKALYGYNVNYFGIQKEKLCFIGESEKFPQQLDTMGYEYGTSVGGHFISPYHQKYLKSLNADKYIVMFDEGLEEDHIRAEAEKLLPKNSFQNYKVGYIFDKRNEILMKGSKMSPTDRGKDALKELCKNHVIWL